MLSFFKTKWITVIAITFCGLFLLFAGTSFVIGRQVKNAVSWAQESVPGDAVTALLTVVKTEDFSLSERNRAVWALGQLGDPRALSTMEGLFTGQDCNHATEICQHELSKAIKLCQGDQNIGALVWRYGELAGR